MDFLKNLAAMVKVKTIVTLVVIGIFAALAIGGQITGQDVMIVVTSVISFYFGTVTERKSGDK